MRRRWLAVAVCLAAGAAVDAADSARQPARESSAMKGCISDHAKPAQTAAV